jgi:cis-L-3-hydroxyproline dehydratase
MQLTREEQEMLDGAQGPAKQIAMKGLIQLGDAFDARKMVPIGYAHIYAGLPMYVHDLELIEDLVEMGAKVAVPSTINIANADIENWRATKAPESLVRLQASTQAAHSKMGSCCTYTCTPYWAGHWPAWNMHMTSLESTVTIFANSVIGARCNRDGFFAVYAAIAGCYPKFGYHLDEVRRGTHLVAVDVELRCTSDYSCLGFHIGRIVGNGVPVITGFRRRPSLDELDALGAALATSGGVAMFIVPGVTPPFATAEQAFGGMLPAESLVVGPAEVNSIYEHFCTGPSDDFDLVHLGCPHASFQEMKEYGELLAGKHIKPGVELWVTTSRAVRQMATDAGIVRALEAAGAKVISDTCPIMCHFARTASPDPALGIVPPPLRAVMVDSAKQAKYVRDMIQCDTLLTGTAEAVQAALTGSFHPRRL